MRIDIAAQSDVGRHKRNNEDFYGVFREDTPRLSLFRKGALLCVADGLGGHVGGEIASKLAVSLLKDTLQLEAPELDESADETKDSPFLEILRGGIRKANDSIHGTNKELVRGSRPMGTTLLAALIEPRKVHIANVGDSRCYHIREGELLAKTEDHSWVDEQVRLGLMSRAEAESDRRRNIVTRCIGTHPDVEIDCYIWHVVPGDILMLCTDGLINMVKESEIKEEFRRGGSSADIAHRLIERANENGGKDNITVIVARISPTLGQQFATFFRKYGMNLAWMLGMLAFGAACFALGYWARGLRP